MSSEKSKKKRIFFEVQARPGSEVLIAGSFNNWDVSSKKKKSLVDKDGNGTFTCALMLPPGRYEYKFNINGEWIADEKRQDWVANPHGTLNSVIDIP
jgi:1,4-alpha-glucan branching enzyme